jgi:hypothetical protein
MSSRAIAGRRVMSGEQMKQLQVGVDALLAFGLPHVVPQPPQEGRQLQDAVELFDAFIALNQGDQVAALRMNDEFWAVQNLTEGAPTHDNAHRMERALFWYNQWHLQNPQERQKHVPWYRRQLRALCAAFGAVVLGCCSCCL